MKKYLANTTISVSVSLPSGGNARISFSPLSDGTSVYYSQDKEIEYALEHHYKYGKLFKLVEEQNEGNPLNPKKLNKIPLKKPLSKSNKKTNPKKEQLIAEEEAEEAEYMEENEGEEEQEEQGEGTRLKEVTVSDYDAAKDYLAENFDIVRTKLKSEGIINETAASLGVVFKFV